MTNEHKLCEVCGSDDCGSQNVEWDNYGTDENMVRTYHLLEQTMIKYIWQSQMHDGCDPAYYDSAREEIVILLDSAIERLREKRAA